MAERAELRTRVRGHRAPWINVAARAALGAGFAAAACGILATLDASLEIAAVSLFLVVVAAALFGYVAGFAAAAVGFGLLLYAFTPPIGEVVVRNVADLLVGVSFFLGATGVGFVVARLNALRRRSARLATEAQLQLLVTDRLLDDASIDDLFLELELQVAEMFDLEACTIDVVDRADNTPAGAGVDVVRAGDVRIVARVRRRLNRDEHASLEQLAGVLALAIDRMRLADVARSSELQADLARSRASFLTAITHDLRTPLATIRAATAALLIPDSELDAGDRLELLELARDESYDLERLLTKVLELTKIRSGASSLELGLASPTELASAAIRRVATFQGGSPVEIAIDDSFGQIEVDIIMMEQVLANLIENASLHSGATTPVSITAVRTPTAVELRVVDHGRGIDPGNRERIFEEFERGTTSGRGMGLGLAIVQQIMELHRGQVAVEDTTGGGATFVVRLPVAVQV